MVSVEKKLPRRDDTVSEFTVKINSGDAFFTDLLAEELQKRLDAHVRNGDIGPVTQTICESMACLVGFAYARLEDQLIAAREKNIENALALLEQVYGKLAPGGEALTLEQVSAELGAISADYAAQREAYGSGKLEAADGAPVSREAVLAGGILDTGRQLANGEK